MTINLLNSSNKHRAVRVFLPVSIPVTEVPMGQLQAELSCHGPPCAGVPVLEHGPAGVGYVPCESGVESDVSAHV